MTLSMWIPGDWQIGQVAPGIARGGAMQRTLVEYIKRHLFEEQSPLLSKLSFEQILVSFAKYFSDFSATQPEIEALRESLISDEDMAIAELEDLNPDQVPESFKFVFCVVMQGTCQALAQPYIDTLNKEYEEVPEQDSAELGQGLVARSHVVNVVAILLRQMTWRWLRDNDTFDETKKVEGYRLFAQTLLTSLLEVMSAWFAVEKFKLNDDSHESYYIRPCSNTLLDRIKDFWEKLPYRYTLQPLKQPVQYKMDGDAHPSNSDIDHCFRVSLISYRRTNDFLRRFHAGALQCENRSPQFDQYVEAVNIQQAVPWRINLDLLTWVDRLTDISRKCCDFKNMDTQAIGRIAKVFDINTEQLESLKDWIAKEIYEPATIKKRKYYKRSGEFLDHILSRSALKELSRIAEDGTRIAFYLPWKADYRGRIYAEAPWLTPQGGDMQRALFEFANGKPLDKQGVRALRLHGANLVRRDQIVVDLEITGRQTITLDERNRWIIMHEDEIRASAEAPFQNSFWRKVAAKPMQFLAFCLAYQQWKSDPQADIHLPVQIDGSCNGLQHIAALTCDEALAHAVDVLPNDNNLPGDIYSELATEAVRQIGQLKSRKLHEIHANGLGLADDWLANVEHRRGWLDRDTAKKVVMTIPYGASKNSQAAYVLDALADSVCEEWEKTKTNKQKNDKDKKIYDQFAQSITWDKKNKSKKQREFVLKCSKSHFKALRYKAFNGDANERQQAQQELNVLSTLASYVALAIVYHLRFALSERYPFIDNFAGWLEEIADACAGMPLLWPTSLGLPVCQDKFEIDRSSLTARLGGQKITIDVRRLGDSVKPSKQKSALLPNLIHSLDATHLAMTLLEAKAVGITDIGSIHDCLLCHPNDAVVLNKLVRDTFVNLYRRVDTDLPEPLVHWYEWMHLVKEILEVHNVRSNAQLLSGALAYPNGAGEKQLESNAQSDSKAKFALTLLNKIRKLDVSQRYLVDMLLDYMRQHEVQETIQKKSFPGLFKIGNLEIENSNNTAALSEYFFS